MARNLPTGTVTFLFTDIEGSTRLLRELGDRYATLLADHHRILRSVVRESGGEEVDSQGEGMFLAFARARDAVRAAVACQRAIATHAWPEGKGVRIRMGLHTGEPERSEAGYVGIDVHRAARICTAGHGGQVLLSQSTRELVGDDLPEGVTLRDLGAHELRDLAHPEHLFQVVAAGLPAEFPPLRSLDARPNNLPRQLTSFVGRERELAEVDKLLEQTSLLTLTGVGGCGKTRLALEVAAAQLERLEHGVWLVELAPLADPEGVTRAVAAALGIREVTGRPILETLCDQLAPQQLLLCLDNCEHVLGACASLVDALLRACPRLRVLATSREGLGIGGELIFAVPSLTRPEAERLFVERARFSRPGFAVTPEDAAAVAQICERLDGIPLALELAAARVRVLSVAELAEKLSDRFRLLTGGSRTALPRHRTLLAAIDWSYELLSEPERATLRSASVFAGGFSLAAAESVCSREGIAPDEVLALLTRLVEKSLVNATQSEGETRYSLLETVRQFALDKLAESGDAAAVRGSHLDWYLRLAEAAELRFHSKDQLVWFARLEREHDNLRAALDWSLGLESAEPALRLVSALQYFWFVPGHWSEGMEWVEKALARRAEASERLQANLDRTAGFLLSNLTRDSERGQRLLRSAFDVYERLGDKPGMRASSGFLAMYDPEPIGERAKSMFEKSLALGRELGDQVHVARVLTNLARIAHTRGDREHAGRLVEESLGVARATGDKWVLALVVQFMATTAVGAADYDRAAALAGETLHLAMEVGHRTFIISGLARFAEIASARGEEERAARLLGAIEPLAKALGENPRLEGEKAHPRARERSRGALGDAKFTAALAEGRALTREQAVAYALERAPAADD
jgi:predicted ATPase/class 3 adenylate cyclase